MGVSEEGKERKECDSGGRDRGEGGRSGVRERGRHSPDGSIQGDREWERRETGSNERNDKEWREVEKRDIMGLTSGER